MKKYLITICAFLSVASFAMAATVRVLVVGGGGGGGTGAQAAYYGGGGGAGGYVENLAYSVVAGNYTVTIGDGGAGGALKSDGTSGGNSIFGTITATGGGGGGGVTGDSPNTVARVGLNGGSGGGGGGGASGTATGGSGDSGGNNGGNGTTNDSGYAGSGGGSGAIGANGAAPTLAGGAGTSNSISGSAVTYAVGGDVHIRTSASVAGGANTGDGGDGNDGATYNAAAGGSGIVIIRYLTADFGNNTGGTETTDGDYTINTFTTSGTFTVVTLTTASPPPRRHFIWSSIIPTARAALLNPAEKIALQRIQTTKLTIQQRTQVMNILRKYLSGKKITYKGDRGQLLSKLINYLISQ